jgi:hypothetical protein
MAFTADSPLAARVVESPSSEVGARSVSMIRAICIHMAEGGGTVPWLTRADGNSSHYVVEYTGRIVQMVREANWAGSINPRLVRTTNDPPYTYLGETIRYGRSAAEDALGSGVTNPNLHVIAIETEGFAKDGPNPAQREALRRLVADIRRRRGAMPCLGHRDFQDYKACPGKRLPWADYGGHGVASAEQGDTTLDFKPITSVPGHLTLKPGRGLVNLVTGDIVVPDSIDEYAYCRIVLAEPYGEGEGRDRGYMVGHDGQAHIALDDVVATFTPVELAPAASASYEVVVGGKPVGSVTLP